MKTSKSILFTALLLLACTTGKAAAFLDLTGLTQGEAGSFTGTLAGISVNGSITAANPAFSFDGSLSVINNTSPQYSYCIIYTPCIPATDLIEYSDAHNGLADPATITITFSSPFTNPIFQVANLDAMHYDFSATPGLAGLLLLSGNGGQGDGLQAAGDVISDANLGTSDNTLPTTQPPTSHGRSAYGSVELLGTFSSLTINVSQDGFGDSGSFTLSTLAPEPSSLALLFAGMISLAASRVRKLRR